MDSFKRKSFECFLNFQAPTSKHIIAGFTSLSPILNKRAPQQIIEDLKAKPGPTLELILSSDASGTRGMSDTALTLQHFPVFGIFISCSISFPFDSEPS